MQTCRALGPGHIQSHITSRENDHEGFLDHVSAREWVGIGTLREPCK